MDDLLDIATVAEYLGVSERTVYNRVRSGELPAIKVGRLWRVRRSALEAWLGVGEREPADTVPGPYPVDARPPVPETVAEHHPLPSRVELEQLLRSVTDQLERRLAFVGLLTRGVETLGWPPPIIVGGHAVEYYTAGDYPTIDIDLAGASEPIDAVLSAWGFEREGRHWYDDELKLVVEVPGASPDAEGRRHVVAVRLGALVAYVIGPEDLVVDRLCAAAHWNDEESLLWASVLLQGAPELDMAYLRRRAVAEDVGALLDELLGEGL